MFMLSYKFLHTVHSKMNAWEDIGQLLGVQGIRSHEKKMDSLLIFRSELQKHEMKRINPVQDFHANQQYDSLRSQRFRTLPNFPKFERFVHCGRITEQRKVRRVKKKKNTFGNSGSSRTSRSYFSFVRVVRT